MYKKISADQLLSEHKDGSVILDVRSPSEFVQGHIPGAFNLPLFDDNERARVGTAYKQISPERAMREGLEIVEGKLTVLAEQARRYSNGKPVIVHCWRGGKRSASIGWLLDFIGMEVSVLDGGYKAYRTFQREWLSFTNFNLIVLGGKTGSGKTVVLRKLAEQGEQVLDLEKLAHHKGSAFGWIGEEQQPTTEHFENEVWECLFEFDPERPIWVENESRTIGKVFIPEMFWVKMRSAPLVHLEVSLSKRVQTLVDIYADDKTSGALSESFMKITKRLGRQNVTAALDALERHDYHTAAEIALAYYDKTYTHGLENSAAQWVEKIEAGDMDSDALAQMLIAVSLKRNVHIAV